MNIVLTAFFNSYMDTQREVFWEADVDKLRPLVDSLQGQQLVVLTDCLKEKPKDWTHVKFIQTKINKSPYLARWEAFYDYLVSQQSIDKVFCVDATDVTMNRVPFEEMKNNRLYIGDEKDVLGCDYMINGHTYLAPLFKDSKLPLLNVGLVGGHVGLIIPLLFDIKLLTIIYGKQTGIADMGLFNLILRTKYKDLIEHGEPVNSHFNKFEKKANTFWTHK